MNPKEERTKIKYQRRSKNIIYTTTYNKKYKDKIYNSPIIS